MHGVQEEKKETDVCGIFEVSRQLHQDKGEAGHFRVAKGNESSGNLQKEAESEQEECKKKKRSQIVQAVLKSS
jgi:hypothetical protein